jgi:hypothetical protein
VGPYDLYHYTAVYAPPPYEGAMRIVKPVNHGPAPPAPWVPADVATHLSVRWDLSDVLSSIGSLLDRETGQPGEFDAFLTDLKNAPGGPKVDVQKEVVARLTGHVTLISDCPDPVTDRGWRKLTGFATDNEKALAATMAKLLKGDSKERDFQGTLIWDLTPKVKKEGPEGSNSIPNTSVTVTSGTLFIADHPALLEKVLAKGRPVPRLANDPDYARVAKEIETLRGKKDVCLQLFARPREGVRGAYELVRTGRLGDPKTTPIPVLRTLLTDDAGKMRLDGSRLPLYPVVGQHLTPAGLFGVAVEDGWDLIGFTLK